MLQIERWAALETGKCFGEDLWEKDGFKRNQDPWETLLEGRIFLLFLLVGEAIKKIYQKEKKISLWIRLNLEHYLIFEVIDHNFFFFQSAPLIQACKVAVYLFQVVCVVHTHLPSWNVLKVTSRGYCDDVSQEVIGTSTFWKKTLSDS